MFFLEFYKQRFWVDVLCKNARKKVCRCKKKWVILHRFWRKYQNLSNNLIINLLWKHSYIRHGR